MSKLNAAQEYTLCELLFAQGARCGYLEAQTADYDGPDHFKLGQERWTAFEAGRNMHGNWPTTGLSMAACAGYQHGFSVCKRGFKLSLEILQAPLPDGLLARARGK